MYDNGTGVPQDYAQAVEWYRKAAGQGNAAAQYNLGLMYANGYGSFKTMSMRICGGTSRRLVAVKKQKAKEP